jgi:hypothetical protein
VTIQAFEPVDIGGGYVASPELAAQLNDPEGQQLVQAIIERKLGAGRTSAADCTCPCSSGGYRRGINPDCPWDGIHPETFRKATA